MTGNPSSIPVRHLLLALTVVGIWGTNFVVVKLGLAHLPPLLLAALRFSLALIPAVFFVPRPTVRICNLALYGLLIGVGQVGLLYVAMDGHISPGIASLVVQMQVFFTIALSMRLSGERLRPIQWLALVLAGTGLLIILLHTDGMATGLGLLLVLIAALSWAGGNMTARQSGTTNMLAYVIWSSAFAVPPLFALSFAIDGWEVDLAALRQADTATWTAVAWQAWANSLFGFAVWGWLLARHPAATVMPIALLIPVFGIGASVFWLGESLPTWELAAAALIVAGLAVNLLRSPPVVSA
jgi:O-acetylserine/cysteine efflux transporter